MIIKNNCEGENFIILNYRCWSYMGMDNHGFQEVSLEQNGCIWKGIIIHEVRKNSSIGLRKNHSLPFQ